MRTMAEDRVSKLFMLVCCCFCITTLLMTYNTFFIDEEIVEIDEEDDNLYEDIQNRNFRDKDRPVNMGSHYHDDDDRTKADELYNRVRVLCWIMTSPSNLDRKGLAVRSTWAKRCNKYIFFSSVTNDSFPTVGLNVSEGRQHLTGKTVQAFTYCYENYGNSFDWFLKADDDTYVIVENLRFFLSHHNPKDLVYFGHRFKVIVKQGYFSGGAGYVLSRQTLKKFVEVGLRNPLLCRRDGGAEDAEIGKCMQRLEVKVGDSLDIDGRESFHPFTPIAHLQGNYPAWFYNQTFHKAQKTSKMPGNYRRQNTYDPNMGMTYDRQISRMTTASAPTRGAVEEDEEEPSTMSRVGRKIKTSIADFFGVGEEDASKSQRWNNRRMRFYRGKYKEDKMPGKDQADSDDVLGDMPAVPHVYDPLRNPARHSEYSSRRTTPLSSTSTYARSRGPPKRPRKESVVKMTVKTIAGARKKLRGKPSVQRQRSFAPASLAGEYPDDLSASMIYHSYDDAFSLVDDVFYDEPAFSPEMRMEKIGEDAEMEIHSKGWRPAHRYGHAKSHQLDEGVPHFGMKRIDNIVRDDLEDHDKRQIGMGFVGRLFNRSYRSDRLSSYVKSQIDDFDDHRPYFTYWVTIVQILCFIVSVAVYGIAPIGTGETVKTEYVMMPNLAIENIRYVENDNLWIGPRQADLIHLGAKYSPCMRRDENIWDGIGKDRAEENTSGCCVRDDGSGCTQTVKDLCEPTLNTFMKWNSSNPGKGGFIAGAVCGQDPNYCTKPASVEPFVWDKNSITNWPYCEETSRPSSNTTVVSEGRHMTCEISGRPCCYGIQGECMITTREHCDFIKGYYHEDKYLCAQANCLTQICGMIPFSDDSAPDQFYRLWTSMFLHGGVFHLVITIGFQFLIMRDIEKLTGCIRMAIIYVGSGIAGNLASSIFLPYHVEVGPAGAQFGILACLLVEVLQNVQMLKRPIIAILKIGGFILFLFLLGLLPWIDNWAHISGFLFGFLLAFALIPYVSFGQWDRRRKIIGIVLSLGGAIALFITLIVLFYVLPLYNCPGCQYFNCIPFTTNFCKNMEVGINRESTYSSNL